MSDWDVIVLGAGPAGSALARALSPQRRVLLLDRDESAWPDLSRRIGESLSGAAAPLLRRLGLFDAFLAQGHAPRGAFVLRWETEEPRWFDPLRDPHGVGWHLDRTRFDAGLRAAAQDAGASLQTEGTVLSVRHEVVPQGERWAVGLGVPHEPASRVHTAPILVDASGRSMWLSRRLGLPVLAADRLICLYTHLPAQPDDRDQSMQVCADPDGWWYSVRVPSGERVLAFHLDSDDPQLQSLRHAPALLAKLAAHRLFALPGAIASTLRVQARPAGTALVPAERLQAAPRGLYVIGDALLAADPISSQGLFNALASAHSAAQAIEAELAGEDQARFAFTQEMHAVQSRYLERIDQTYRAVRRHAQEVFWARRQSRAEGSKEQFFIHKESHHGNQEKTARY